MMYEWKRAGHAKGYKKNILHWSQGEQFDFYSESRGWYWRILSRRMTWSDSHFKKFFSGYLAEYSKFQGAKLGCKKTSEEGVTLDQTGSTEDR